MSVARSAANRLQMRLRSQNILTVRSGVGGRKLGKGGGGMEMG